MPTRPRSARPVSATPSPARRSRAPYQALENTYHKRGGERRPGGIPSAGRSRAPRRDVCFLRCPLPGARATSQMLASSGEPAARPHGWCPAAAPSLPSRVAWSWERSWRSWRSDAARGRLETGAERGKRPTAPILEAHRGPRSSRSEAWRPTWRAANPALRAHGPQLGRRPASSPEPGSHTAAPASGARARAAVCSSPSPGAGRLCARGTPAAAASSGCCSRRRRLPLLRRRRPLPAFPAGPEAAAESRSG